MSGVNSCPYPNIVASSKTAVVAQLSNLKSAGVFAAGRFISAGNAFRVIGTSATTATVNAPGVGEYVAGSCIVHLYDGWRYLGAALRAFCRNDVGVCGHAAYYAELRGAMSFLAANGVFAFKSGVGYLDRRSCGQVLDSSDGTHKSVWNALESLANIPGGNITDKVILPDIICPGGYSISDWMSEWSGGIVRNQALYADFLRLCGADIQKYEVDRERRNRYSYSPTEFDEHFDYSSSEISGKLGRFWDLFSPTSHGEFREFDFGLLCKLFHTQKKAMRLSVRDFRRRVEKVVNAKARSDMEKECFFRHLYGRENCDVFLSPNNLSGGVNMAIHEGILLRACCMLRLATAACRELLASAGVTIQDLDKWLMRCQQYRFMWQAPVANFNYDELWVDVDDSVTSLGTYSPRGSETWLETEAKSLEILSRAEYIMFWGLS